jgi:hypothetical protein
MEQHLARWVIGIVAVAVLALAPSSFASDRSGGMVRGEDRLITKNEATQTLQLEDVTLQVLTTTRIYDGSNRRISFRQIDEPAPRAPILVGYEGTKRGTVVDVSKVVVRLQPH